MFFAILDFAQKQVSVIFPTTIHISKKNLLVYYWSTRSYLYTILVKVLFLRNKFMIASLLNQPGIYSRNKYDGINKWNQNSTRENKMKNKSIFLLFIIYNDYTNISLYTLCIYSFTKLSHWFRVINWPSSVNAMSICRLD